MVVRRIVLILFLSVLSLESVAQIIYNPGPTLTTANGLPSSIVTGLVQDKAGFIWLGTTDGLARYDGRQVKVFRHDRQPNPLAENSLSRLQRLLDGTLLLQTLTGDFQRFDPVSEQFFSFLPLTKQGKRKIDEGWLTPDNRQFWALWRGEKIQAFDQNLRLLHTWDSRVLGIAAYSLHSIAPASGGLVYAHCDKGLVELNGRTGQHRLLPFQGPVERRLNTLTPVKDWKHVVERPNGEIMVIGQQYLLLLNPHTGQYRDLAIPGAFVPDGTYAMNVLADDRVYLSSGNRLYELLPNDQFVLVYEWDTPLGEQRSFGLPYLLDTSGVLWLHTHMGDVKRLDTKTKLFQIFRYQTDWKSDVLRTLLGIVPPGWKDSISDSWTRFAYVGDQLWFIDMQSVYRASLRQRQWKRTLTTNGFIYKIVLKPDQKGNPWVYVNQVGLVQMDSAGQLQQVWPNSLVPQPLEKRGLDIADFQVMDTNVWMASNQGKGLYRYDLRQKKIVAQLLPDPANTQALPTGQLRCLARDLHRPSILWIGTAGGGLTRYDTRTGHIRTFTDAEGLPNNTINSLLTDQYGFLWIGTNKGLVRLDTRSFRMRRFSRIDGLQDDELGHTLAMRLPDGRLAFGGQTGITVFDPGAIREDAFEPPVVLSSLRINNGLVEVRQENSPLDKSLNEIDQLTLTHTQNFLTFEFAALEYRKPGNSQYRYRMVGIDPDWVNTGGQNTANYTQLAPGYYQFAVMATNADGRWSRYRKQINIVVRPPFWKTWWAYTGYALLFGGFLVGFIRLRINRLREQQEVALRHREAEQLRAADEVKNRFFANITHEFRTPLTLILSPTEKLLQESRHDEATRQALLSVRRNAGQVLRLVNQLLDLAKLESGTLAVSLSRGDGVAFIRELVESFAPMTDAQGTQLQFHTTVLAGEWLFDAEKWEKIITNLLSNALKFTPAGGLVSVTLHQSAPDQVAVQITDTGVGIAADKLPYIFDRFYQVDDTFTRKYQGTGIGLALVRELVDLLDGTIAVESEPGRGTAFLVHLPVRVAAVDFAGPSVARPASVMDAYKYDRSIYSSTVSVADRIEGPLVLVVDDNEELRAFMAGELADQYRVITAGDGELGWRLTQAELPDVVISDVMMPGLDGYQLTKNIKSTLTTSHIAVVLLTARTAHDRVIQGLTEGADEYMTKPFHVDELRLRVHNLLEQQQRLRTYYQEQFLQADIAFQPHTVEDNFLKKLYACIESQLDNSAFGVEELARDAGISRRTLHRKLMAVTNLSTNDFIRQYRLKRAAQLLQMGHNVSETAILVGYESLSHFTLIFKELYHKTPTEFIQR